MYEHELNTAIGAVREAAVLAEQVARNLAGAGAMLKTDASPVTLADYGVQAIVHRHLAAQFPADPIVAEEDADDLASPGHAALAGALLEVLNTVSSGWSLAEMIAHIGRGRYGGGAAGRFWTLDPIDGTKGFLRNDQYAIALALIEHGRPVLGVLGCPRLRLATAAGGEHTGWLCYAVDGSSHAVSFDGTNCRSLHASAVTQTADIVLCESVESGHSAHDVSAVIARELGIHRTPVRMDSQAKYAAVAAGAADVYLRLPTRADYREKIWDHAAGVLLVQNAGGRVGDVAGNPLDFSQGRTLERNRGVIASAAGVHERVTQVVKPHFTR